MDILLNLWLTHGLFFFCVVLSFSIPWMVYKTNRKLHQHGDPPWKTKEDSELD